MAKLLDITQGWTKELGPFTLMVDGVPINLDGYTVELLTRPVSGSTYSNTAGDVRLANQFVASGQVYYKPDADDFRASKSPYTLRWKVTDGAGDVAFWPNGVPDTIGVHKP